MDYIDAVRCQRWRRWNRRIYRAILYAQVIGLRTRRSSQRGDLYFDLQTELVAYRVLARTSIPGYDRRRRRRMLARERRGIRAKVQRIRDLGDRVWWSFRLDGSGVDLLIAGEQWPPTKVDSRARPRRRNCADAAAPGP